jgi:DNA-binding phage protein
MVRDFTQTLRERAQNDAAFRSALLTEAVDLLLSGDVETGKIVLRGFINATVGFEKLAAETGIPSKSLMRMLSAKGNPRAHNLFTVLGYLQRNAGVHLAVRAQAA